MGALSDAIFGGVKEAHDDGTVTERFSGGTSITRYPDGTVKERTSHETTLPVGMGEKITVTSGSDDNVINVQKGWGPKA